MFETAPSGDALSVALFFAAAGIAFMIPTVQEQGWKRWLFAGWGAVSFLCALFWPAIQKAFPALSPLMTAAASSDLVHWLGGGIIGFSVGFWVSRIGRKTTKESSQSDAIKLMITECFFQENTPNEVHFGLRVTNPGPPSVLKNWRAVVTTGLSNYETSVIPTLMRNIIGANGLPCGEVLPEGSPLEQGSEWQGGAKFGYDGNALARFGTLGNEFTIFAEDVRGHQIKSEKFTLSKIFVAPK